MIASFAFCIPRPDPQSSRVLSFLSLLSLLVSFLSLCFEIFWHQKYLSQHNQLLFITTITQQFSSRHPFNIETSKLINNNLNEMLPFFVRLDKFINITKLHVHVRRVHHEVYNTKNITEQAESIFLRFPFSLWLITMS